MSRDLIRLMHAFFLPGVQAVGPAPWQPNTDVYRTATGWLIKFELAGVRADEIELEAIGCTLSLRGVRRDTVQEEAHKAGIPAPLHYRMELHYSHFQRQVELPCDLKAADITTHFRDGLLLVHITPG